MPPKWLILEISYEGRIKNKISSLKPEEHLLLWISNPVSLFIVPTCADSYGLLRPEKSDALPLGHPVLSRGLTEGLPDLTPPPGPPCQCLSLALDMHFLDPCSGFLTTIPAACLMLPVTQHTAGGHTLWNCCPDHAAPLLKGVALGVVHCSTFPSVVPGFKPKSPALVPTGPHSQLEKHWAPGWGLSSWSHLSAPSQPAVTHLSSLSCSLPPGLGDTGPLLMASPHQQPAVLPRAPSIH